MLINQLGIEIVTLDLPFRLNHVNCFLAEGEAGYVLIDTGLHNKATKERWNKELKNKQVEHIILTHLHPDHCGYAGGLQKKTGAKVSMSKVDTDALETIIQADAIPRLEHDYADAAVPAELATAIVNRMRNFQTAVSANLEVDDYLQEGAHILIGKEEYEVIFTPGHTAGLVCFYNHSKNVLLSTDHILPKITPNIAYWFYGEKNPLQSYENSLKKIKSLQAEYVIPSHGKPFYDVNKRIDEIWQHHEERLEETIDILKERVTIFDVCKALFTKELSVHDYQFAIGETIAHLEYLRQKNECTREKLAGKWVYYRNG